MNKTSMYGKKHQLADDLELLVKSQPVTKEHLPAWYDQARQVHERIRADFYDCDIPHFVIHFLIDADTRLKDSDYSQVQQKLVCDFINDLRKEEKAG